MKTVYLLKGKESHAVSGQNDLEVGILCLLARVGGFRVIVVDEGDSKPAKTHTPPKKSQAL